MNMVDCSQRDEGRGKVEEVFSVVLVINTIA